MIDYHLHTGYTNDAKGKVEDFCQAAIEKKIGGIAFTNHFLIVNIDKPGESITPEQIFEHAKDIQAAREKFDLKIKLSLESDYWQAYHKDIERILNEHDFDFILGSVHYVEGYLVGSDLEIAVKFFQSKSMYEAYEAYFKRVIETVESQLFDVIAHPDYIRKNAIKFYKQDLPFERYQDMAEKVIEALVDNNVGIEVNTSGYRHGINDCFPSLGLLKLCKESGVKIITLGSDAHSPNKIGFKLKEGVERLRAAGYEKISLFNLRKAKQVSVEEI